MYAQGEWITRKYITTECLWGPSALFATSGGDTRSSWQNHCGSRQGEKHKTFTYVEDFRLLSAVIFYLCTEDKIFTQVKIILQKIVLNMGIELRKGQEQGRAYQTKRANLIQKDGGEGRREVYLTSLPLTTHVWNICKVLFPSFFSTIIPYQVSLFVF